MLSSVRENWIRVARQEGLPQSLVRAQSDHFLHAPNVNLCAVTLTGLFYPTLLISVSFSRLFDFERPRKE